MDISIGISQPTLELLKYARFQRGNLWDVLLPDISPTILGISTFGLIGFTVANLACNVEFGDYSIGDDAISIRYGPYQAHFAGLFKVPRIKITFIKTFPDIVSAYFDAWRNLIIDTNGLYSPKVNYQKTIYVRFLDSTGIAIGRYKLLGAFPVTFPSYSLAYSETDSVMKVSIEFEVDKLEYQAL